MLTQEQLHRMGMGAWNDAFYEYRQLYNFETKSLLYSDIEKENQKNRNIRLMEELKSRPVASIRDL